MTDSNILLVKNSWNYLANNTENAGEYFYQKLFEIAPSVRPLFKTDINDQARKLVIMLSYVISKLNSLDEIEGQIKGLAQRHVQYGARPEHYQAVGQALIMMLEDKLGNQWNEPVKDAWIEVFTVLSGAMIGATTTTVAAAI